jgi:hypothetical protein
MFTVEMEFDETVVTVLDDDGHLEDVKCHLMDDVVYFRQFNPVQDRDELIQITPHMWEELVAAFQSSEGAFRKE